jgi:hypothetical protein
VSVNAPESEAAERRWKWAGRSADSVALGQAAWQVTKWAAGPAALAVGSWLTTRGNLRDWLVLLAGVLAVAIGASTAGWALVKRGDPYLACDERQNRRVTRWLRAGTVVAAGGLVVVVVAVRLLVR